jgi:hypothetical protein
MKKYIILVAAAIVACAACSKVETLGEKNEINFNVAKYVQTKASGSAYDTAVPFGTYAWFTAASGSTNAEFMVNEKVAYNGSVWTTADHTFYWPKTGYVEFISYSPFAGTSDAAGSLPVITANSITYTDVTVGTDDLMYADKVKCSENKNEITDDDVNDSGFSGVPTLFHHALAKLSFKVKANFTEWKDAATNTTTKWEVTITSFKIDSLYTKGSCALALNADGKTWNKPVTTVGTTDYNVWTVSDPASITAAQELVDAAVYPDGVKLTTEAKDLTPAAGFVMPQVLAAGAQKVKIVARIKTTLSNGRTIEENFEKTVDISGISSLKAWQMNQNIIYTINFKPTAKADPNGHDDDPEDVKITFDPAVADWTVVNTDASIQL